MTLRKKLCCLWLAAGLTSFAADQTQVGAGNSIAAGIGPNSPLVQSAFKLLIANANQIQDATLRQITLDAITNPQTCIQHRAGLTADQKAQIVQTLVGQGLINPVDGAAITGGISAGVFPPVLNDGTACPNVPLQFMATPGSNFGGHHSYPGGLAVHESLNDQSSINFASTYRGEYGSPGADGIPIAKGATRTGDTFINQDVILAAPIWHDWAKMLVFQWNADGTEFTELNFGGAGSTDNYGAAGDSRTGGHHIIGIAESMKRGLAPDMVITQASAHSNPSLGNEYKVVNWLRAAAIIAQIDPVAAGYLFKDASGNLRLPPLRSLGSTDLLAAGQFNNLIEYQIHNLSDADFTNSIAAVTETQVLLAQIAPEFGYTATDTATFNNKFRNVIYSYLSPERLEMVYSTSGLSGVIAEVTKLRAQSLL